MDRDSLANKLVRTILAEIAAGGQAAGSQLPSERALTEEFKVSRGTVRQALGVLEELGVIERRQGSGAFVKNFPGRAIPSRYLPPKITNITLDDILSVRKAIELTAIELACDRISAANLKTLTTIVARMETETDDLPAFLKDDMAFHETVIRSSDNCPLVTAFEAVREYHRYAHVFTSRRVGDERAAVEQHRRILLALRRRDAKAAVEALRRHLESLASGKSGKKGVLSLCAMESDSVQHRLVTTG
ncbi:MAG: FadR/GntR family transcriptional regulator [Thermoguttaceae bacterium]